ncbi:MAG: DUF58 domain-containing protein [Spirochaetales bacterium]|nr:MAG: DUF58 domain-containing protein [Spirochaetales bacterium]
MDRARLLASVKRIQLVATRLVENLLAGDYRSVFRGPGIEFDEVREYVDGDDARLIDWNVSSRMDAPYLKTFREERELTMVLIVDVSASLAFGPPQRTRREIVSELFALLSLAAAVNNDRVGAVLFSDRIESWVAPKKGKRHVMRLINDMVTTEPVGTGSDLALALRTTGEALKRRGVVVVISDFKTTGYLPDLTLMGRRHDVIAIRVVDPLDRSYPETGLVRLEDPESRKTILAPGKSRRFRAAYEEFWHQHRRTWAAECRRRKIGTLEVWTDKDPAAQLISYFEKRKGR